MENFEVYNPVHVHFGKDVCRDLGQTVARYGNRILLVYGKGSIFKNGNYEHVKNQLDEARLLVFEQGGIKSNPIIEDVRTIVKKCYEEKIEVLVALGGGSVIDSAKVASLCAQNNYEPWDVMTARITPRTALPIIAIPTIAATASEMNKIAVIQNLDAHRKTAVINPLIFPKHSFLDPQLTFDVSEKYTAYGIADIIAHAHESFFGNGNSPLSDAFIISIIREVMEIAPALLKDLRNYDLRARMMWAATSALNGSTMYGKTVGDWGLHRVGHELSLIFDVPHGASLSIVMPAWFRIQAERIPERIIEYGKAIFGVNSVDETIEKMEMFMKSINSPVRLSEIGIDISKRHTILNSLVINKATGVVYPLMEDDLPLIVDFML